MNRKATDDVTLSNGLKIPKHTRVAVSTHSQWDAENYANPKEYQFDRHVKLRERPGQSNHWMLSTPSTDNMGFGYGSHACPGRFIATNVAKIVICNLLMKYEWRISPGSPLPTPVQAGVFYNANPFTEVDVKGRAPEIQLDVC